MTILALEGITTGYKQTAIVKDVSLAVVRGEFLGIIGPNGAGKSTLFRAISGILPLWQGSVLLGDKDIRGISRRKLAKVVAAIPQFQALPFPYTVEEFVIMGRYPHKGRFGLMRTRDVRIVEEALGLMDLTALKAKKINALSGGELQRVFLAQGLAQEPLLLLMDEPTAHLDIGHQVKILDTLKRLCLNGGLTVVMILHDLNLASAYCDKLILMRKGGVYAQGTPPQVLKQESIEMVYGTSVDIRPDPVSGRPFVFVKPGYVRQR
jgi:iron complex transport system ATP-binding protein